MESVSDNFSNKQSPMINHLKSTETNTDIRPLSPVLLSNGLQRKMTSVRRRDHKIRRKLLNKFTASNACNKQLQDISKIASELETIEHSNAENRLKKIKEYENEKKKYIDRLYIPEKTICTKEAALDAIEFDFKKPISPLSSTKKQKSDCNTLIHDRKVCGLESKHNQHQVLSTEMKCKGFLTGTGKSITISQENIIKHSKIFDGIFADIVENNNSVLVHKENEFETSITDTQMVLAAENAVAGLEVEAFDVNAFQNETTTNTNTEEEIKNSFAGFDSNDIKAAQGLYEKHEQFRNPSLKRCGTDSSDSVHKKSKLESQNEYLVRFAGSGNSVMMEQKPLQEDCRIFDGLPENLSNQHIPNCLDFSKSNKLSGFSTANGKRIKLSEVALQKARQIFDKDEVNLAVDERNDVEEINKNRGKLLVDSNKCVNFATASGKSIPMQQEALQKASHVFNCLPELNYHKNVQNTSVAPRNLTAIQEEILQEVQQIFDDLPEFNQDQNVQDDKKQTGGFVTAGGRSIRIQDEALQKAKLVFDDLPELTKRQNVQDFAKQQDGFVTAAGKSIAIPEEALQKTSRIFDDLPQLKNAQKCPELKPTTGFATAGGRSIAIQEKALQKAKHVFDDLPQLDKTQKCPEIKQTTGFATAGGKSISIQQEALQKANRIFDDLPEFAKNNKMQDVDKQQAGFTTAAGKSIAIQEEVLQKSSRIFDDLPQLKSHKCPEVQQATGFATAGGRSIAIQQEALQKAGRVFDDLPELTKKSTLHSSPAGAVTVAGKSIKTFENSLGNSKTKLNNEMLNFDTEVLDEHISKTKSGPQTKGCMEENGETAPKLEINAQRDVQNEAVAKTGVTRSTTKVTPGRTSLLHTRKRLGISSCKQITIPNEKLKRAKQLFEDLDDQSTNSPKKFNQSETMYTSTPLKELNARSVTPMETILKKNVNKISLEDVNITPIKKSISVKENSFTDKQESQNGILLQEHTKGDVNQWLQDVNEEYRKLEQQLRVITERKQRLEEQKSLASCSDHDRTRQRVGSLLDRKRKSQRLSLRKFVGDRKPGDDVFVGYPEVTPQTAEYVHFNCARLQTSEGVIKTSDNAILIPNTRNLIGLSEIKSAFEVMPGIDVKLLPREWIANHFKWIVWKLASYERNFSAVFNGCLSLDNILEQLKYRYDREIDKAERSALRNILEKDDISQKRMVLCVAQIIKVPNGYELELTDGWYSIQTVIDQALCRQVDKSKIVIGTKLMVQGAEILNCDGCHPLETPAHVRLKINYNCTRRAAWHLKLGYQFPAEPFPIKLKTIHSEGGLIGCIKVHIARAYPLRYMERENNVKSVWRNKKAEEKRAQQWENQRMKQIEMIEHKIREDFTNELTPNNRTSRNSVQFSKLQDITSPQVIYEMLETTDDPESIRNALSSTQLTNAMNYKSNLYMQQQQELSFRISQEIKHLKCTQRDVVSVLKLRVVDVMEESGKGFAISIWKPNEEHLQILKEGSVVTIYNVLAKRNGDLASMARTQFKIDSSCTPKKSKMKRYILPISLIQQEFCKPTFNEFDTVGTVVKVQKDTHFQEVWLTDTVGRLLLIKVTEGPDRCCLLDNVYRSQTIAAMNLLFCKPLEDFAQAIANQCSIITSYPQQKFLQAGLAAYKEQLPKDLTKLLEDCDTKIEASLTKVQLSSSVGTSCISSLMQSHNNSINLTDIFDDSSEDAAMIQTRLTTTDVAMSLLDI